MAPKSHTTRRSPYVNIPADPAWELDELTSAQDYAKKSNIGSNKIPIFSEAPTLLFVLLPAKDLFTKFMKVFMATMQAQTWNQELLEPRERPLKARTPETYSGKFHIDYYYFCQQYKDY